MEGGTTVCRVGDSVTHIRVNNDGDCFNLIGSSGETFATIGELVRHYRDGKKEATRDTSGAVIELKYPLPCVDHHSERYVAHGPSAQRKPGLRKFHITLH